MSTADEFLNGGGSKSASFNGAPPITVSGTITRVGEPMQQRDLTTGKGKTFDNGDPMMMLPVDLQTTARDDTEDDGIRTLYVKGGMRAAIRDAIRAAKAEGLRVGGTLTVTYTGDAKPSAPGLNGAKQYAATYAAPSAGFFTEPEQPSAPVQAAAPAAPAPTPAPSGAADPVGTARQLITAGLDDGTVAAASGLPIAAVAALRNSPAA